MKKTIFITLFSISTLCYGQLDSIYINSNVDSSISLNNQIIKLNEKSTSNRLNKLLVNQKKNKSDIRILQNRNEFLIDELTSISIDLKSEISASNEKLIGLENLILTLNKNLEIADSNVSEISESSIKNTSDIQNVNNLLTEKHKYSIYSLIFLIIVTLTVYIVLSYKWNKNTRIINLKQKEIFEKQIQDSLRFAELLSSESKTNLDNSKSGEIDHSFAKRVADEIVRMQTNLSRMDESIKGFRQLSASVKKLEQSLNSNYYELEDLLNLPFSNGMNIQAVFVEDENLKDGESIITRIIKPQINYKGKLIQAAQVEVSQGF